MAISDKPPARPREANPPPPVKDRPRRRSAPEQLSLVPVEFTSPSPPAVPAHTLRQLWLCLYLPALPLEAVVSTTEAAAVFEEQKGIRKVLLANARARTAGIQPGLSVNAALALVSTLVLEERDRTREAQVLKDLAEWSEQFTAFTSIDAPSLLLLEIAGSRKLFGGIKALRENIVSGLVNQGFDVQAAIAPTPLAATWLARAGKMVCIRDAGNLVGKLAPLPISCLCWPEAVARSLSGMGITSIGEALRLPRQGFARRFSATRLLELDRALGRMPDPRASYRAPERFAGNFDLNEEESDSALLLNVCQKLLNELECFLLSQQMATQQIEFVFFHLQVPATHLSIGCVKADRSARHWFDLLEIKFDRTALAAPVIAIHLDGGEAQRFTVETDILPFNGQEREQRNTSIAHLAERLSARIGDEAVHGVMMVAEHRPQYAWQRRNVFDEVPHCASVTSHLAHTHTPEWLTGIRHTSSLVLQRPLWMLPVPGLLATDRSVPCYQGVLRLLDGPERLETGWWDDDGIARDYFVACNPRGVHLWIYQDRSKQREDCAWYLHGMFG